MTRTTISSTEARKNFDSILNQVEETAEVVVVTKYGKPKFAIVPLEYLEYMKEVEQEIKQTEALEELESPREEMSSL